MSPLVTLIIPCYNYAHYLPETLDSVLAQSLTDWEAIIVDDGSTDNTKVVATEYVKKDNRFQYIYQENQGLSSARNTGIAKATGKYLQLLDADDLLEDHKLSSDLEIFNSNPAIDIVYTISRFFSGTKNNILEHISKNDTGVWLESSGFGKDILKHLIQQNRIIVCVPLFKTEIAKQIGFKTDLKSHEDWDFWLQCCLNNHLFHFKPLKENESSLCRLHDGSMITNIPKMKESSIVVRKTINNTLDEETKKINKTYLQRDYIVLGLHYKNNNLFWKGQKELWNAFVLFAEVKRTSFAFVSLFVSGKVGSALLKYVTGQ